MKKKSRLNKAKEFDKACYDAMTETCAAPFIKMLIAAIDGDKSAEQAAQAELNSPDTRQRCGEAMMRNLKKVNRCASAT